METAIPTPAPIEAALVVASADTALAVRGTWRCQVPAARRPRRASNLFGVLSSAPVPREVRVQGWRVEGADAACVSAVAWDGQEGSALPCYAGSAVEATLRLTLSADALRRQEPASLRVEVALTAAPPQDVLKLLTAKKLA